MVFRAKNPSTKIPLNFFPHLIWSAEVMGMAAATTKATMSAIQASLVQLNLMLSGMATRQEQMRVDLKKMTAALAPTAPSTPLVMPGEAPLQPATKPSSHSIALDDHGTAAAPLCVSPALSSATPTSCSTVGLDSHTGSNHAVVAPPYLFTTLCEAPAPTEFLMVHPMQPSVAIKFSMPAPAMCSTECCHTNAEVQPSAFAQEATPSASSAGAMLDGVLGVSADKIPSRQQSALSPWLGNTVHGIPVQQEGISCSSSPTESRWFLARKRPWDPGDVANECDLFIQSFALICWCQMGLVLNYTCLNPKVTIHTNISIFLGTSAEVQLTTEAPSFQSSSWNQLVLSIVCSSCHLGRRSIGNFDMILLLEVHIKLYKCIYFCFLVYLANHLQHKTWDPGVQSIEVSAAAARDVCARASCLLSLQCRNWCYIVLRLRHEQAIAWGQAMFRGGDSVTPVPVDVLGLVRMGLGLCVLGLVDVSD